MSINFQILNLFTPNRNLVYNELPTPNILTLKTFDIKAFSDWIQISCLFFLAAYFFLT